MPSLAMCGLWRLAQTADPMQPTLGNRGVGPINSVKLGPFDPQLAMRGEKIFETNCGACHKFDQRYVGPPLRGVTRRRAPEWILNMILNPAEMLQKDPIAKALLAQYNVPMTFQNLTQADARAVLEYLLQQAASEASGAAVTVSTSPTRKKLPGT